MPLYTYRCQDCQAILELLIKNVNLEPARCGLNCTLNAGENDNIRGFGELQRSFRDIGGSQFNTTNYRKIAGHKGPDVLDPSTGKPPSTS